MLESDKKLLSRGSAPDVPRTRSVFLRAQNIRQEIYAPLKNEAAAPSASVERAIAPGGPSGHKTVPTRPAACSSRKLTTLIVQQVISIFRRVEGFDNKQGAQVDNGGQYKLGTIDE